MNVEVTKEDANTTAIIQWEVTGAPVGLGIASAVMDTDVKVMKCMSYLQFVNTM